MPIHDFKARHRVLIPLDSQEDLGGLTLTEQAPFSVLGCASEPPVLAPQSEPGDTGLDGYQHSADGEGGGGVLDGVADEQPDKPGDAQSDDQPGTEEGGHAQASEPGQLDGGTRFHANHTSRFAEPTVALTTNDAGGAGWPSTEPAQSSRVGM